MKILPIRNLSKIGLLVIAVLIIDTATTTAQDWQKKFVRQDILADKGDYKLARELNHNLKILIKTKLGLQNSYAALAHFKDAKYYAGAGYLNAYKRSINSGFSVARGVSGRSNIDFAKIAMEGIEVMVQYGDYGEAEKLIAEIEGIFETFGNKNSDLEQRKKLLQAYLFAGQGHIASSLDLVNSLENYMKAFAAAENEPDYYSRKNPDQTRKLTSYEIIQNKRKYADYLALHANLLFQSKLSNQGDSLFNEAEAWVTENLNGHDQSLYRLKYKRLIQNHQHDTSEYVMSALLHLIRKSGAQINRNHELALSMKYDLIKQYQIHHNTDKYIALKSNLEKLNNKYYDNKNIHPYQLSLIALQEDNPDIDPELAYQDAFMLLENAKAIPEFHSLRVDFLRFLHEKALALNKEPEAKQYVQEIVQIEKVLYGENAPKLIVGNE